MRDDIFLVFAVGANLMALTVALVLAIGFWRTASQQRVEAVSALAISWLAAAPGITQLITIIEQGNGTFEMRLGYFWVNLLWYICGPLLIAVSTVLSPPRDSPGLLNTIRAAHLGAWSCSAWFILTV